jgi:hypothetical protein
MVKPCPKEMKCDVEVRFFMTFLSLLSVIYTIFGNVLISLAFCLFAMCS